MALLEEWPSMAWLGAAITLATTVYFAFSIHETATNQMFAYFDEHVAHSDYTVGWIDSLATGKHTGRSASDKYTVRDAETEDAVWWNKGHQPMAPETD